MLEVKNNGVFFLKLENSIVLLKEYNILSLKGVL